MTKRRPVYTFFAVTLVLQGLFWWTFRDIRPDWGTVSTPLGPQALQLVSFGETQALYRFIGLELQNAGDTGGRMSPMTSYDYRKVVGWLNLMDLLDMKSDYAPALAALVYGVNQDNTAVRQIVTFLSRHATRDPQRKWRWLAHAAYIARHRMKDLPLALGIARNLAGLDIDLPIWARQLPAFIMEGMGDKQAAALYMNALIGTDPNIHPAERRFMEDFINRNESDQ